MSNDDYKSYKLAINFGIFPEKRWPNRKIHYVISALYKPDDAIVIKTAIRTLNELSCLKFVPYDASSKDFLLIWPVKYPEGCWSYVGRRGGGQLLSLTPPNERGSMCLGDESKNYIL